MSIRKTIITAIVGLTLVAAIVPVGVNALTTAELTAQINALKATLAQLTGTTTPATVSTGACAGVTFSRNMTTGATGSDVKCLQTILNQSPTTQVSATGAGSPGNETTYFGPRTLVAVRVFQSKNGMTPAGQVGPMTRAKLNSMLAGGTVVLPGVTPPVVTTGPVSAMLSSTTPAAGSLINSQASAGVLDINFVGNGTVTSVTLQRAGISVQNTLSAVYLYEGATRLTDGYSFNASGSLTMNGLSIPVNGSKVVSIKVDTASDAVTYASSISVALTSYVANGVTTVSSVAGNNFTIVTGSAATAYMTTNNATANASVNAGTSQYTMWSDTIQVNTRTVQLKGMNFKIIGSAPTTALANIKLFVDGIDAGVVATVSSIQGSSYAMFNFATPVSLATGTHTIDVRADIVTGANRTIQLSVQQAADLTVFDPQVGVNLAVQASNGVAFTADSGTTVAIQTGSSTVVVDPTFNSQTTITAGSTNAVIGKYLIHGYGEDVKVSNLYVTPELDSVTVAGLNTCATSASGVWTAGTCGLNNVTLYFNGSQVGTQKNWTMTSASNSSAPLNFSLGSQMIIPANQDSILEVRADIQNADSINYTTGTVKTTLVFSASYNNALGQSSSEIIDFPTADQTTSGLSVSSGTVVVSKNTSYATTTVAPNTSNVRIGSFTVQNQSSAEAVRLTTLTVNLTSNGTAALNATMLSGLSALKTSDTTGSGSNPIQPSAGNTFSVNDVLQPNGSMTIDIFANVGSSTLISAVTTRLTVASIGAVSNISDAGTIATGQAITFSSGSITAGNVTMITSPTSTTPAGFIPGGAGNTTRATFQFIASSAAATVSELKLTVSGSDTNPTQIVTNVCVLNGNGTTKVCAQPAVYSGTQTAYITGLSFNVPTGSGVTKQIDFEYADVGLNGLTPGVTTSAILTYVKYTSGSTTTTVTPTVATATTNTVRLVSSVPSVAVSATTGAAFNTSTSGTTDAGRVTVTAGAKPIRLRQITFNIGFGGYSSVPTVSQDATTTFLSVGTTPVAYCNVSTLTATCTFTNTGAWYVYSNGTYATYASDFIIDANSSTTFDLNTKLSAAGTPGTGTLSETITLARSTAGPLYSDSAAGMLWSDTSTNGASGTLFNDYYINGFPTGSTQTHN